MTFRAFRITLLLLVYFTTTGFSFTARKDLDQDDGELATGFGYELLIAKMEFLEQKISLLEATVTDLKGKQTGICEESSCCCARCSGNFTTPNQVHIDETERINSCSDVPVRSPGFAKVNPAGGGPFDVLCDFYDYGGNWTIIQHRYSGEVDFYRTWEEYKQGFGELKGEFWLGLDKIHRITNSASFELVFVLIDRDLTRLHAHYDLFRIGNESEGFIIDQLGAYKGTAGDSFRYHAGMKFTTWDRKNDKIPGSSNNCAVTFHGAWWYNNCQTR
ncbi:hypothetical protein pipiens_016550 [Culex pipiens pipiens]|uniref:Fibrinogen C-terminal domain-containing protein n=1 Tax=Culex pipiens pipiens TaxID=38569 RepID=A0ABD1CKU5_CULPP